jgi:hypothetical protein
MNFDTIIYRQQTFTGPLLPTGLQNLAVATVLFQVSPEPATLEEKKLRRHLETLLDAATIQ